MRTFVDKYLIERNFNFDDDQITLTGAVSISRSANAALKPNTRRRNGSEPSSSRTPPISI